MNKQSENLRNLPSVNELLSHSAVVQLVESHGRPLATWAVRRAIDNARAAVLDGGNLPDPDAMADDVIAIARSVAEGSLRPVVNATGVVLHTNLGRAPLGKPLLSDVVATVEGYTNLEFDLKTGRRGNRTSHVAELLKFLTGAEDAVVVNNNAAAIVLTLSALALGREVLISRGELIEIGGSFRLPEVMHASGAVVREVGMTNRTHRADYENAIGSETSMIFKAHKSNYAISGFTEEVSVKELAELAHARELPLVYDIGSGLLRKPKGLPLDDEPDVQTAIRDGADLVMFSGDKLLGGPQAGIIAGKSEYVRRLAKAPLMRALRVGKTTLAALASACRCYLNDEALLAANPAVAMLERPLEEHQRLAERLLDALQQSGIDARVIDSAGQCGGGTLPDLKLPSAAVEILPKEKPSQKSTFAERVFQRLLEADAPVLGVLREGRLLLDVLTVFPDQIDTIVTAVGEAVAKEARP